jgi:hypothetical protein
LRVNGVGLDHNTFPPSLQYLQLRGFVNTRYYEHT